MGAVETAAGVGADRVVYVACCVYEATSVAVVLRCGLAGTFRSRSTGL